MKAKMLQVRISQKGVTDIVQESVASRFGFEALAPTRGSHQKMIILWTEMTMHYEYVRTCVFNHAGVLKCTYTNIFPLLLLWTGDYQLPTP
jgi:hypothetical protein